jgi:predicted dehydrogenase
MKQNAPSTSRRDFLKTSAVAGGVLAAGSLLNVHADGPEVIRIGLVGCGGRGSGAVEQCLRAGDMANPRVNVRLVALGDAFRDRAARLRDNLRENQGLRDKVDVPDDRLFIGLDAYQQVINNVDLVLLATPPGFRPTHLSAAVAARKHIFTEKPVAVDGPGVRTVLQAFEAAERQRLSVVAGTQRRYQPEYLESMRRIHDGALGTITSARCYWNQGGLWHANRTPQMTDLQWQLRNWLYFTWLSGDHIVEQHIHNLDAVNWALGNSHPVRAAGLGGRQVRTGPEFGHIFDHFAIDFEYPNNIHVTSMCRQIVGCENNVSEAVTGTKGSWTSRGGYRITGENAWTLPPGPLARGRYPDPYELEHVALLQSIRSGQPINDLKRVAESTLTAILGRTACYTGQVVTWNQVLNSQAHLVPERLSWDMTLPVPPVAVPGQTPVV